MPRLTAMVERSSRFYAGQIKALLNRPDAIAGAADASMCPPCCSAAARIRGRRSPARDHAAPNPACHAIRDSWSRPHGAVRTARSGCRGTARMADARSSMRRSAPTREQIMVSFSHGETARCALAPWSRRWGCRARHSPATPFSFTDISTPAIPRTPWAAALAVQGPRIEAVGSDAAILKHRSSGTAGDRLARTNRDPGNRRLAHPPAVWRVRAAWPESVHPGIQHHAGQTATAGRAAQGLCRRPSARRGLFCARRLQHRAADDADACAPRSGGGGPAGRRPQHLRTCAVAQFRRLEDGGHHGPAGHGPQTRSAA